MSQQRIRRRRLSTPTIHNCAQNSPEWFELRKGRVTASNAWKLLEKGYKEAVEQKIIPTTAAMQRGKDLEPEALEIYSRTHDDVDILTVGFVTNPKYPNAGASPDGVVGDKLIEVKCFGEKKHIDVSKGNIPFEVMAQVQMQMMICELESCDLVLYNPDLEPKLAFKVINIPADEVIHRNIRKHLDLT